ncbi:hypothetical protein [Corynebacterium lubricantis]|uniref:hypothetical protein n=1 Tax=Corynebacterium lubricantis TaxID=541095 RepID=UPI000377E55F|nr:hypothetical protein [Corynebacterium lubricantis]
MDRVRLIELGDLEASLSSDHGPIDTGLAFWAIEIVSATALSITGRDWRDSLDVPPGAMAVMALATRRLYTNPDRFTRESEGDYSYGLDATVTKADVFTASEQAELRKFRRRARPKGIGTISTYREEPMRGGGYVPDGSEFGFPWYSEGDS